MKIKTLILFVALCAGLGFRWYLEGSKSTLPSLTTSNNQVVSLQNTDDPRLRIAYFGFTHCPDVCPTSLAVLAAALNSMEPDSRQHLLPLFISLDPERDTPEKSAEYAHYFHDLIIGASTTVEHTKELAENYGVLYRKAELSTSSLDYAIDHSSFFYIIGPNGELLDKVPHTMNPAMIVNSVQSLLPMHIENSHL
ncbi:SCO family protein [Thaumasiovibrio sp. DFM-14]|uniref:SCO family protein n=1 Tax=Thaumasiovibrio sp. DFM-14 TaxID=3384792 RepID=UPI0039A213C2